MPIRRDPAYDKSSGIVLFHAARSNCSARVRLLLAEKSLDWESRLISLQLKQNHTAEYFAINPKGLVPSMICDGSVITESNDILRYLEARFPNPRFLPADAAGRMLTDHWLALSADIHLPAIKTWNYSKIARTTAATPEQSSQYRALQTDQELVSFHAKASGDGFSATELARAEALLTDALAQMDDALADRPGLAGDSYGLADICWATTIPTLVRSGFAVDRFKRVHAWHERIAVRPAYATAVTAWESAPR